MVKLNDYDLSEIKCKNGDIKVNAMELLELFRVIQPAISDSGFFVDYFFNKYIVLGEKRLEEQKWYNLMKELDEGKYNELGRDAVTEYRKEVFNFYSDAKIERASLTEELRKFSEIVDN